MYVTVQPQLFPEGVPDLLTVIEPPQLSSYKAAISDSVGPAGAEHWFRFVPPVGTELPEIRVGGVISLTSTVFSQLELQPSPLVTVNFKVYGALQFDPAATVTFCHLFAEVIVPFPEMLQV